MSFSSDLSPAKNIAMIAFPWALAFILGAYARWSHIENGRLQSYRFEQKSRNLNSTR